MVEQLLDLALGDADVAGDGGGDDGDAEGRDGSSCSSDTTNSSAAATTSSPSSVGLADVPPSRAVAALAAAFESGERYADVRSAVVSALPTGEDAADFIVACVEHMATSAPCASVAPGTAAPLTQLLLEALHHSCATTTSRRVYAATEDAATRVECAAARTRAANLVAHAVVAVESPKDEVAGPRLQPRAVAKLVTTVSLEIEDLTLAHPRAGHAMVSYVGACLGRAGVEPASAVAAAALAKHFSLSQFTTATALDAWEVQGHGSIADGIAATLSERRRRTYASSLSKRKGTNGCDAGTSPADRADRHFKKLGLPAAFPEEERAGQEGRLRRLAAVGRWDVAEQLAGEDVRLRGLVRGLRDAAATVAAEANGAGWSEWAASSARETSEPTAVDIDQSYLPTHLRTLPLDLPRGAVRWVDDVRSLAAVVAQLSTEAVLGIDTEWVPDASSRSSGASSRSSGASGRKGSAARRVESPTALVQLSGERCIALLDATRLGRECPEEFAAALRETLCAPRVDDRPPVVVGFGVTDDLRRLASSYPGVVANAVREIPRVLCLQRAATDSGHGSQPGLSSVCQSLLGQPLDKRERCGDWSRRPLTEAQILYGAQDARVLLRILPGLLLGKSRAGDRAARGEAADLAFGLASPASDFIGEIDATVRIANPPSIPVIATRGNRDDATPLTPADVAASLRDRLPSAGGDPAVIELGVETGPAASDTASSLGDDVPPESVVKSMGVMVAGDTTVALDPVARALGASGGDSRGSGGSSGKRPWEPVMLLLRGTDRADLRTIARHFGVARRHARLATPDECVRVFGYPPGSMPPLGHRVECPTLMDTAIRTFAGGFVYPGAGAPHLVFRCLPAVLERATAATTLPIAESSVEEATRRRAAAAAVASSGQGLRDTRADSSVDWALGEMVGDDDASHPTADTEERQRRFVADGSLGRLARWLRCLGVDAEHVPAPTQSSQTKNPYGALLALAQRDDRVILTKDRRLLQRKDAVGAFLVEEDDPKRQLARVSAHFGLRFRRGRLLTRCAKCNGAVERRCTPEEVAANDAIPAKVKASTSEFWACGRCEKVYWVGPKSHLAMSFINAEIAPTVTRANDEMARMQNESLRELEEAVVEEALGGNPWPRRTGPGSREE